MASDWHTGLASSRRRHSTNSGFFSLKEKISLLVWTNKSTNVCIILEVPQHSFLVELIGAVLDVNFEMLGSVFQKDIANLANEHVLLPAPLQVGQKSFRAFTHRHNIGE